MARWRETKVLTDPELIEAQRKLAAFYGEPVLPVSAYCNAFATWLDALAEKYRDPAHTQYAPAWLRHRDGADILLAIRKSNLLYRLIYCGEPLRERKCPLHQGVWSGIGDCVHGCHQTGWLPNEKQTS